MAASFDCAINDFGASAEKFPIQRNSCLAHLLQLAIKDALKHPAVSEIAKKVNHIITWFHKTNIWYTKLKSLTKLALKKPCETRWNSFYHCLYRLLEEVQQSEDVPEDEDHRVVTVAYLVNEVIRDAKKTSKKNDKIPHTFTEQDLHSMRSICDLLEPFANLTDDWQADGGVTSSIVLVGLIEAFKEFDSVIVDDVLESIMDFRNILRHSVISRFGTDREKGQEVKDLDGNERHVVSVDVFWDENYIIANLLDPRFKTLPFDDPDKNPGFPNGWPTLEEVKRILEVRYQQANEIENDDPVPVSSASSAVLKTSSSTSSSGSVGTSSDASENSEWNEGQSVMNDHALKTSSIRNGTRSINAQ